MTNYLEGSLIGKGRKFALVVSRFNELITKKLLEGAIDALVRHEVAEGDIDVVWVPGSFEVPLAAKQVAASGKYNAVICLGAVIRGDTPHADVIAAEAAKGVAMVGLDSGVPTIFGILTPDTLEQAIERAGTKSGNRGAQAAMSALEMADLFAKMKK